MCGPRRKAGTGVVCHRTIRIVKAESNGSFTQTRLKKTTDATASCTTTSLSFYVNLSKDRFPISPRTRVRGESGCKGTQKNISLQIY